MTIFPNNFKHKSGLTVSKILGSDHNPIVIIVLSFIGFIIYNCAYGILFLNYLGVYLLNKMMKCAKCQISVKTYFTYCPNCGASIGKGYRPDNRSVFFLFSIVLVFAIAVYVIFFKAGSQTIQVPAFGKNISAADTQIKDTSPFSKELSSSPKTDSLDTRLSIGTVVIYDISGNQISRSTTVISENGWIAIPAKLCVGGYRLIFYSAEGEELEIFGGILEDRDNIGIWQFKNSSQLSGLPIFPVNLDNPMTWMSIVSEKNVELSVMRTLSEQQNFYHIFLDDYMNEPGVLIQDQKIVGWTFGDLIDGGYLWKGMAESNLVYEFSVYDFYRMTFENSREERFIIAYSKNNMSPMVQLETFANGFRLNPMLSDENTPAHLKPKAVIIKMRTIITQILDEEYPDDFASILDNTVLSKIGDVSFLIDVLTIGNQINGPEHSLDVIENVLADPKNFNDSQLYQIQLFRKKLYRKWLTFLMHEKDYSRGLEVYRQTAKAFIDDFEIQLLGVKLALVFNDWEMAEEILYSQRFPIDLTDQIKTLKDQIAELKFQEDKIVIRFSPGASRIPVNVVLNNRLRQDFIVDTGASMVTIPITAAKKLGIKIDTSTPIRDLITAGGMIKASQITLNSIQLDGWTEYNVTAYVIDIPTQSGVGLLGLNYLNRFRMDLNTQSGVLTLAPQ